MRRPTENELIDLALGRLEPSRRESVERWLRDDVAMAQRARAVREHLRRYDALPPAPPPPSFELVERAMPDRGMPDRGAGPVGATSERKSARPLVGFGLATAAIVVLLLLWTGGAKSPGPASLVGRAGDGLVVVRQGREVTDRALRGGDTVVAHRTGEVHMSDSATEMDVRVVLASGARIEIPLAHAQADYRVGLPEGRAFFQVERVGRFTVRTPGGDVVVRGTEFEVVVEGASLDVRVARGRVEVGRHRLDEGDGIHDGQVYRLRETPGAFFRRPVLRLRPPASVVAGRAAAFGVTLANPTMIPMEIPGPEGVRVALWLEVEDPSGTRRDVPVEITHPSLVPGRLTRLAAEGLVTFEALVAAPFRERGTYRCQAMYRPEGEPPLVSDTVLLEVR